MAPTRDELRQLLDVPLSEPQLAAVTAPLEPGVIVAGAGSGKTTVMAARVVWLVASGQVRPDQVLGLTFTNKAAGELAERVTDALRAAGLSADGRCRRGLPGDDAAEPTVSTYHAFAGRLVAEHGLRLGIEPDLRLLTDASRFCLAAQVVREAPGPFHRVSTNLATVVGAVLALDAALSEHLVEPDDVRRFSAVLVGRLAEVRPSAPVAEALCTVEARAELLTLVERYRRAKRHVRAMDFSDQMAFGARVAQRPAVGGMERERFGVVLLDEYQDTSVAQRRMLAALFSGPDAAGGRGHPVTAVGDPCQAIYGWRGASVANLEEFPAHFPTADGRPAARWTLNVSRRCAGRILSAANAHAASLYAAHSGVEPLSAPAHASDAGHIRVALHTTYAEEVAWVAAQVGRTRAETPGLDWSDIAVLVHDNADAAALGAALRARQVPVEVVGLGGLLATAEVAEVVAVLEVLHDLTANPAVLQLLTGPRWRIGPRDLALLGRRARELAGHDIAPEAADTAAALEQAVGSADPTDTSSLIDALDSPGGLPYSVQARERFALFSAELRRLRRYAGEPLVDLVRRVVEAIGLDVELAASAANVAAGRWANVSAFADAVSVYATSGDDASLPGLLAYLRAEADHVHGLAVGSPTPADSVKLLSVHKAKGLEWDVVFVPMLVERVFPSGRGRPRWPSSPAELPWPLRGDAATLPDVQEWSPKGLAAFRAEARAQDLLEERRVGYVAFTRARHQLVASGHWWGPSQVKPRGPSEYLRALAALPDVELAGWEPAPDGQATNPALDTVRDVTWPSRSDPAAVADRQAAAALVGQARSRAAADERYDEEVDLAALTAGQLDLVAQWDVELAQLLEEASGAQGGECPVELPRRLSATQLLSLRADRGRLASELARPMPRRPLSAGRFGSRFHAWVEAYAGGEPLLRPAELPGAADAAIADDAELRELCQSFQCGPYGHRTPTAVEAPFSLLLAGQVIAGRIDAVYATPGGYQVVDWKTSELETADPLQLAIYRLAWAELRQVCVSDVDAVFYHVRSGAIVRPSGLPGRAELAALLEEAVMS